MTESGNQTIPADDGVVAAAEVRELTKRERYFERALSKKNTVNRM